MAVPKKRTGHSAQGKRRSNWKAVKPATAKCPNCGATVLAHTVCTACGTYKGKPVSLKDRTETETKQGAKQVTEAVSADVQPETAEEKKTAKKSTGKKAETTADDVKTEENTEVKAEETTKEVAETEEKTEE